MATADSSVVPVTEKIYVDKARFDSYTETGSLLAPFKTIQAAIDYVQAQGDNSDLKPYCIDISTGVYAENLVIAGAGFVNLSLDGHGSVSVGDLTMSVENAFKTFFCNGIGFQVVTQIGAQDAGTPFEYANQFVLCAATDVTLKNLTTAYWLQSYNTGVLTQENCFITAFQQQILGSQIDVTWVPANPKPAIAWTSFLAIESCVCNSPLINVGSGAMLQARLGSRVGAPGGAINVDGDFTSYNSFIRAGINVSATGNFTNSGSFYDPAGLVITPGGTLTNNTSSELLRYDADPVKWVAPAPVNVQEAITRLASVVAVLNAGPIA